MPTVQGQRTRSAALPSRRGRPERKRAVSLVRSVWESELLVGLYYRQLLLRSRSRVLRLMVRYFLDKTISQRKLDAYIRVGVAAPVRTAARDESVAAHIDVNVRARRPTDTSCPISVGKACFLCLSFESSILYQCGHVSTCAGCAVDQCPLCDEDTEGDTGNDSEA